MAKSPQKTTPTPNYKEVARARVEQRHRRNMLIVGSIVGAVLVGILAFALVNELLVKPGQPVAEVGEEQILTKDFRQRVQFERHETIQQIYQYAAIFGVEQVYGFVQGLDDYEQFGEHVLDTMINQALVKEGAANLDISVDDNDVSEFLEVSQGYYRHGTPTPQPTVTSIATSELVTDTVSTPVPTRTPRPTPTAVTEESFQNTYDETLKALNDAGVNEEVMRNAVAARILEGKMREQLVEGLPAEEVQISADILVFADLEEMYSYYSRLEEGELVETLIEEAHADVEDSFSTRAINWSTYDDLFQNYSPEVAQLAFTLKSGDYSDPIVTENDEYLILYINGREMREMSSSSLMSRQNRVFDEWLEGLRNRIEVVKYDYWSNRVPNQPTIDLRALIPTPTTSP
ncbi:MAG: SurA N-terminal domain-containing protein [Chloroflexota bacterium]